MTNDTTKLKSKIADLDKRRRNLAEKIDTAERERGAAALAVEDGDEKAAGRLEKISAKISKLKTELATIEAAIDEAGGRLTELENRAIQSEARANAARLDTLIDAYVAVYEKAEALLHELASVLSEAAKLRGEIFELHKEIRKAAGTWNNSSIWGALRDVAVWDRLGDFIADIGLGSGSGPEHLWLKNIATPRWPGKSLAELERQAVAAYRISEADAMPRRDVEPKPKMNDEAA